MKKRNEWWRKKEKTYAVNAPHSLYPFCRTADPWSCGAVGNRACISTQDLRLIVLNVDFQPFLCVSSSCTLCLMGTLSSFQVEISKCLCHSHFSDFAVLGLTFLCLSLSVVCHPNGMLTLQVVGRMFGRNYNNFCSGLVSCVSHFPTPPPILTLILSTNWGKQLCSVGLAKKFF